MTKILLLQSDDQLAANTTAYLKRKGFDVSAHKDPQAAVAEADANLPDIVILDLSLAGRTGVEFLYELRSYPDWQAIPAIITGSLTIQHVQPYLDSFNQLDVAVYLPRQTTSLARLAQEVSRLSPVPA
jgi:DNA-binding response OmpR family regulator